MGKRRIIGVWAGVLAMLAALLVGTPAAEAEGVGGPLQFEGTANLPKFPCSQIEEDCNGTFDGTVEGTIGGQNFETWMAELRAAELTATFGYDDQNCTDGTARGTAFIDAGLGDVTGFWRATHDDPQDQLSEAPVPIVGLDAQVEFDWDREGLQATLRLLEVDVQLELPPGALPGGETMIEVVTDGEGAANAVFVPIFDAIEDAPDCTGSGNQVEIDAEVSGTAALADAN